MRIWSILYPIGIYFVVTAVVQIAVGFSFPSVYADKVLLQMIASAVTIPFLCSFYLPDQKMRAEWAVQREAAQTGQKPLRQKRAEQKNKTDHTGKTVCAAVLAALLGFCFSLAWNTILGAVRLYQYSASYQKIEATFYAGSFAVEIVALCIVVPIAEELLYRGIVYGRIRDWLGVPAAVAGSAVIFGAIHMNLVQFVYAGVFGLILAMLAEYRRGILYAACCHMAANFASVLRAETSAISFLDDASMAMQIVLTILLLAVSAALFFGIRFLTKENRTDENSLSGETQL